MWFLPLPLAEGGASPRAHCDRHCSLQVAEKENHAGQREGETGEYFGKVAL